MIVHQAECQGSGIGGFQTSWNQIHSVDKIAVVVKEQALFQTFCKDMVVFHSISFDGVYQCKMIRIFELSKHPSVVDS